MNRILIIQTAFLGDVILATPVIAELNRLYPSAQIDVLVKKGNESLLTGNPKVNAVYTFNKKEGKYQEIIRLIRTFRAIRYDLILNLHRFASSGIIATLSKGKKVYGFRKNPMSFLYSKKFDHNIGNGEHEVSRNLSLIKEFGATRLRRPELFPLESDFATVKQYMGAPYYCVAPASVWYTKQLTAEKWIELINNLGNSRVFLLGGKEDRSYCENIKNKCVHSEQIVNLAGELNLLASAALLAKAERSFVNDSGPLHISSAMNTPTTAFFCSTIPNFGFGPLSDNSEIREVQGLDCRPCGLHGYNTCPKGHFKCATEMDVNL